jgi:hypothetical protein
LDRRLGGPQSQFGCGGEEKNSQTLPRLELPITQPIAQRYTTELPGSLKICKRVIINLQVTDSLKMLQNLNG